MGRNSRQTVFGTVRWQRPDAAFKGNETTLSNQQLQSLWYPRLPRQDSFRHDQERRGLASSLQFRPTDKLDLNLNYVHAKFDDTTTSLNSFAQFRRLGIWGFNSITPTDVTLKTRGADRPPLPAPSGAYRCGRRAGRPRTRPPSIS
jgi:hypothetical protein